MFDDKNDLTKRSLVVSICDNGIGCKVIAGEIRVKVDKSHPLVLLALALPWRVMYDLILDDLKTWKPGLKWWLGRKLRVRIHLGAYILQKMYDLTDRKMEYELKDNAAYQLFCGKGVVDNWHAPDHTKLEEFRNRLKPETQRKLANLIASNAVDLGVADASQLDIDSTIQEANMTYPTDSKMLRKLGTITAKVANAIKELAPEKYSGLLVDLKEIASKARNCFFQKKYATTEEKSSHLRELWNCVRKPTLEVIHVCRELGVDQLRKLKWNIFLSVEQLLNHGEEYLEASNQFIETGKCQDSKRYSFHLDDVDCFNKGKAHKKYEFGRTFQLGRIGGNFIIVSECTTTRMDDKKSVVPMLDEHEDLFGKDVLKSLATDKGYYSRKNIKAAKKKGIDQVGIQAPCNIKNNVVNLSIEEEEALYNRRAGIEPLIGHAKQGGQLGRSRMKNDESIKSSGYASVMGFNLRQTVRAVKVKTQKKAA